MTRSLPNFVVWVGKFFMNVWSVSWVYSLAQLNRALLICATVLLTLAWQKRLLDILDTHQLAEQVHSDLIKLILIYFVQM